MNMKRKMNSWVRIKQLGLDKLRNLDFIIKVIMNKKKCCRSDLQFVKLNLPTRGGDFDSRRWKKGFRLSKVSKLNMSAFGGKVDTWLWAGCNKKLNFKNEPRVPDSYNYTKFQAWTNTEHINLTFTGEVGAKCRIWEFLAKELIY